MEMERNGKTEWNKFRQISSMIRKSNHRGSFSLSASLHSQDKKYYDGNMLRVRGRRDPEREVVWFHE